MSEFVGLGVADAESRWIGVRRHQACLCISGLGLIGQWVTASSAPLIDVVAGVLLVVCAVPTKDGLTIGERLRIGVSFLARTRWMTTRVRASGDVLTVHAHGDAELRGYELSHRGRLDLSGRDRENARTLSAFADGLATSDATQHFSLHVLARPSTVTTLLAAPRDVGVPACWIENRELALQLLGPGSATWLLERWTYVRTAHELIRVVRIRDFSSVPDSHALLEQIQFATTSLDVAVHVEVVGGTRARRLASRAVHRVGSDDATSQAAGFRRTAQTARSLERLRQRERLVVEGAALLRVATYVIIRASSLEALRRDADRVTRLAVEAGLRCDVGAGRQASWYCAQLPGGPGW